MSLCDWPGKVCAVLFLGGCNLRCPTCHNFELAWAMEKVPQIPAYKAKIFLAERRKWLGGVTITGGEPTIAPDLADFLSEIREFGLPVKLDTNGMRPDVVATLLDAGLVEQFAVDVKGPYSKYPQLTGGSVDAQSAARCLTSIFELAEAAPERFYFRCTHVPLLDDEDIQTTRAQLPQGFELLIQDYKPPRRKHALAHQETRRPAGDMVHRTHRPGRAQGPDAERNQRSAAVDAARQKSRNET
jgi:pyruvate formate lyase activating enzyme